MSYVPVRRFPRGRAVATWVTTALACLLVLFALVAPDDTGRFSLGAFLRVPVEGLVFLGLVLLLPGRAGRVLAVIAGVVLGLLTILKVLDLGFNAVLERPFDPVLDWHFLSSAMDYLTESISHGAAVGVAIGAGLLAVAVPVFTVLAVLRLTRLAVAHKSPATGSLAVLGVVWVSCATLGTQFVAGQPFAARSAAGLGYATAKQVKASLRDRKTFAQEEKVDAFRGVPAPQLLTALQGKNVIFCFVESYGRSAVEDPKIAPGIDTVLDAGTAALKAKGFAAESGWLTSSTSGGGSWLAHSTLLSGLWVDNQQRYDALVTTDRLTLTDAFRGAGWRTVAVMPDTIGAWPEASFYGYDKVYAVHDLGYRGPTFSWATMPDQYTLSAFQRAELAKPLAAPVMAEVVLVSSHAPWAPIPSMISWNDLGNGSVFDPQPAAGRQPGELWRHPSQIPAEYGKSIQYSLTALISYLENYGTKNTVMVFLGDHQPASIVTGVGASRDVPIAIVAHDPAVLQRISGWGWTAGLKPASQAPVWPMSAFRDNFLTAFSPGAK